MDSIIADSFTASGGPTYRKHFIPLESNPDVFNNLISLLGASQSLVFEDVLSLDEPDLLPHPAVALILVFPTTSNYEARKVAEDAARGEYNSSEDHEDVLWFKQTINNACGLYGILHALANGEARGVIETGSLLGHIFKSCSSLPLSERSLFLENSEELEKVYKEVAVQGSSEAPDNPEDEVDYHYVCFVKSHRSGRLYELDGDRTGPIDRGQVLGPQDDVLAPGGLNVIREYIEHERGNSNFGLMALVRRGGSNSVLQTEPLK
ncbi:ubiquitin carboxyl-terminal hydrolase, family 1 [Durotheca rogersii]|uniref:ubiquitin carboxyl-terminal hydrolase, family 1 n=1 Tax=Durotheca rogersii TaxID=419775 RepID=UPI00221ECB01|nr:ubiquitin carboxyl-terminal hydrolase, family 1 [Durotheca rogersii]KAI5861922.1 ubiquitin carboxyl-terminal hydrolase, family 1 [Durotheca rogersii]